MKGILATFIVLALVAVGVLTSSTQLVFSLPAYGILTVGALLAWFSRIRRDISPRVLTCLGATGIFFGYVLLRAIFSPDQYIARADIFIALGSLMLYLLTALYITSAKRRLAIVVFLLFLGVANVAVGTIQYVKGNDFMVFGFMDRSGYGIRASGFYICPNHLAGLLEVLTVMGLSVACWSRWKLSLRLLFGYLAVMCLAGIIMTGSRGGYLSAVVGLLTFAVLSVVVIQKQNKWFYWRVVIGNLLLICILIFGAERIITRNFILQSRVANIANTEDVRVKLWQSGLEQFRLNPIAGTGSRTFIYYGRQFRPANLRTDPIYAHNDYLQFLAEYGLLGMAGLVLFLGAHLRSGFHEFASVILQRSTVSLIGSNSLALNIGALASVAAYMVHSFLDFNLHVPANSLLMAFVFGLLTDSSSGKTPRESQAPAPRFVPMLRLVLPALAVWMAVSGLSTLPSEYHAERARLALSTMDFSGCERHADAGLQLTSRNPFLYYYKGEALEGIAETTLLPTDQEKPAPSPTELERLHERAADYFRRALALSPQEQNFVLSLAWALDNLKRFDEAEPLFLRALELDPKSPQMQFHYAAHIHRRGRRAEAVALYRKAHAAGSYSAQLLLEKIAEEDKAAAEGKVVSGPAPN